VAGVEEHLNESIPGLVSNRYCVYEPIIPRIQTMRVLLVNNLIAEASQYSAAAQRERDFNAKRWVELERKIAGMALANIAGNVQRLVRAPAVQTVHLAQLNEASVRASDPDAILLSGTLRDFDLYHPDLLAGFQQFIQTTGVPVLAICGGHQLVGQAFGAEITDAADPIFTGVEARPSARWQKYTKRRHLLRVWQNHGLEIDRLPTGFRQLARGYLSEYQMIVKRTAEQLIYGVQFHIEKSFQDWQTDNYWEHRNESRDGRLLFDNFLVEALKFRGKGEQLVKGEARFLPATNKAKAASTGSASGIPTTGF
jgi:GMP synthase-like glutamine amidotransferase